MREMGSLLSKSMRNIYRGCGLNKSDERHIRKTVSVHSMESANPVRPMLRQRFTVSASDIKTSTSRV